MCNGAAIRAETADTISDSDRPIAGGVIEGGGDFERRSALRRERASLTVQEIALNLSAKGEGVIRFDVGCDGQEDGNPAVAASDPADAGGLTRPWAAAANRYLDWAAAHGSGPGRDGSGWRLVPVRVTATGKAELMLSQPKVVVQ